MEEYLEDPRTDEEFYPLMKKKLDEINSLDVSDEQREHLYALLRNNIANHEREKNSISQERIDKAYNYFGSQLGKYVQEVTRLTENNSSLNIAKVNLQIGAAKQKPILETIEKDIKLSKGIEKNLGKADSIITAETIIKGMRNQN